MPGEVVQQAKPVKPVAAVNAAAPVVEGTSIWKKWWLWAIVVLVIAGLIVGLVVY